uniref:Uncharacterized protein n=1 Tax=Tanacetum cinerariifolium TaxID=118510 RepID=A0A6L2NJK0_TANCI|nr:hypothetical protein [Tanacetum cinerariifolium]
MLAFVGNSEMHFFVCMHIMRSWMEPVRVQQTKYDHHVNDFDGCEDQDVCIIVGRFWPIYSHRNREHACNRP